MSDEDQVKKLRLRVETDNVTLLEQILEDAEAEILDYTNRDILPERCKALQRELAVVYYNRMGSEGETSRSEGGISVAYSPDIPDNLKARLKGYRRLKVVGIANANQI